MRYLILLALSLPGLAAAQPLLDSPWQLQLSYGAGPTFHHRAPVPVRLCREGCTPETQTPGVAGGLALSLYRRLGGRHQLSARVGYRGHRFSEAGQASRGGPEVFPYQYEEALRFVHIAMGHRYFFAEGTVLRPFWEHSLTWEVLPAEHPLLRRSSLGARVQIGATVALFPRLALAFSGYGQTALLRYNREGSESPFLPFGYGVEVGLGYLF